MGKAPFVFSEFGYWIDPQGGIHPVDSLGGHGPWLVEMSRLPDVTAGPGLAAGYEHGWIGVEIQPTGLVDIGLRAGAVDKRAARALRQVLTEHLLLDADVRCSRGGGLGKDVARAILIGGCDGDKFPDPRDEIASLVIDLDKLSRNVAQRDFCVKVLGEGNAPDFVRLNDIISSVERAANKALDNIRAFDFGPNPTLEHARSYAEGLCVAFENHAASISGIVDGLMPAFVSAELSEVPPLDELELDGRQTAEERIRAVRETISMLEKRSSPYAGLSVTNGASQALQDAAVRASMLKSAPNTIPRYVAAFRKEIASPDVTAKRVADCADYFIGHECGRTLHNIRSSYLRDLRNAMNALRRDLDESKVPSP